MARTPVLNASSKGALNNQSVSDFEVWQPRSSVSDCIRTYSRESSQNHQRRLTLNSQGDFNSSNVQSNNLSSSSRRNFKRIGKRLCSVFRWNLKSKSSSQSSELKCSVIFLDGNQSIFRLPKSAIGQELFNLVVDYLNLRDEKYFGLAYSSDIDHYANSINRSVSKTDLSNDNTEVSDRSINLPNSTINSFHCLNCSNQFSTCINKNHHLVPYAGFNPFFVDVPFWLKMDKKIVDQCGRSKCVFYFQVRFYPRHPEQLIECPKARKLYCLQLRHHLLTGRLLCSFDTHIILGALIAQMDYGDAVRGKRSRSQTTYSYSHPDDLELINFSHIRSSSYSQSLPSRRSCSLAEPENSDNSIVWNPKSEIPNQSNVPNTTTAATTTTITTTTTNNNNNFTRPHSLSCYSKNIQIDLSSVAYLESLPHLAKTQTLSMISVNKSSIDEPSLISNSINPDEILSPSLEYYSPGWPYPKSDCHYCPILISRIRHRHRYFRGMSQTNAECLFLENVKKFSLYGIELHSFKKFHVEYRHSGRLRNIVRSFSDRKVQPAADPRCSVESSSHSLQSPMLLRSEISQPNFGQSLKRIFQPEIQDSSIFPFEFSKFPNFDFSFGVYHSGLILYWGQVRFGHYSWSQIVEMFVNRDEFILIVRERNVSTVHPHKIIIRCKFGFAKLAKRFFEACVDHHQFFRISKQSNNNSFEKRKIPPKPLPINMSCTNNSTFEDRCIISLSVNDPLSIEQSSVNNIVTPLLPITPSRSESDFAHALQSSTIDPHIGNEREISKPIQQVNNNRNEDNCSGKVARPILPDYKIQQPSTSLVQSDKKPVIIRPIKPFGIKKSIDFKFKTIESLLHYPNYTLQQSIAYQSNQKQFISNSEEIHPINSDSFNNSFYVINPTENFEGSCGCNQISTEPGPSFKSLPMFSGRLDLSNSAEKSSCTKTSQFPLYVHPNTNPTQPISLSINISTLQSSQYIVSDPKFSLSKIIKPTYSSLIQPNGQIIRLTNTESMTQTYPMSSTFQTDYMLKSSNETHAPQFIIPTVRTHVIRFIYEPSVELNEYGLFADCNIHHVCGETIPVIATKSLHFNHNIL